LNRAWGPCDRLACGPRRCRYLYQSSVIEFKRQNVTALSNLSPVNTRPRKAHPVTFSFFIPSPLDAARMGMYPSAMANWVTRRHSSLSTDIAKSTQANLRYTISLRFQYRSPHTYIHKLLIPIFSNTRARIPTIHTLTPPSQAA
jgi:hypothetical protein